MAQFYTFSGQVHDAEMALLPMVDVRVQNTQLGTRTNDLGYFELKLVPGEYTIYFSSVGYQTYKTVIIIDKENVSKNIILNVDAKLIGEVTVSAKKTDITKSIVRKVIENKKDSRVAQWSYDAYIFSKSLRDSTYKKKRTDDVDTSQSSFSLAEIALHVDRAYPDKISEKRDAVKILGDEREFYYLSATEGDYDFMKGLVSVRSLGETPFLSPFSSNGLLMYNFEMIEILNDGFGKIYHFKFWPNSISNNLMTGEAWVTDKTYKLIKIKASFPNALTPAYKYFEIEAEYDEFDYNVFLPTDYTFTFQKIAYPNKLGTSKVSFENYQIDSAIDRSKFSNMISQTTQEAYERDTSFWNMQRTVPLTPEEVLYIQQQDSIIAYKKSEEYKDSVDKSVNKIKITNLLWSGSVYQDWRKDLRWYFPALPQIVNLVAPGGFRVLANVRYYKKYWNKRMVELDPTISYGTLNKDWQARIVASLLVDPVRGTNVRVRAGRSMDNMFWGDAILNVLSRNNFYLRDNYELRLDHEVFNGFKVGLEGQWNHRQSISDYKFYNWWDQFIDPDNTTTNKPVYFNPYNAFVTYLRASYTPKQLFIREPFEKIILGSKWPTFYTYYKGGLKGIFGSVVDFDYIELGITQNLNLGPVGILQYNTKYGNFINEKNVEIVEHKRIAKGNPLLFFNPLNSFQAMDSTFSIFSGFVEGHVKHDFNGFLISKIPYASRLKITEVAGASFILAPERDLRYVEFYFGLEKIFTFFTERAKIGVFGVKNVSNSFNTPFQIKFGLSVYDVFSGSWR